MQFFKLGTGYKTHNSKISASTNQVFIVSKQSGCEHWCNQLCPYRCLKARRCNTIDRQNIFYRFHSIRSIYIVCFITKSFLTYSFVLPTQTLSTICRPLSSYVCSRNSWNSKSKEFMTVISFYLYQFVGVIIFALS